MASMPIPPPVGVAVGADQGFAGRTETLKMYLVAE